MKKEGYSGVLLLIVLFIFLFNLSYVWAGSVYTIQTASQRLYLGDNMNDTKTTLTKTDLPFLLADGNVTDTNGTTYYTTLKIDVPNTNIQYGRTTDNLAIPVLYAAFSSSQQYYADDIVFTPAANVTNLSGQPITLFGQQYIFSPNSSDLNSTQVVLYTNSTNPIKWTFQNGNSVTWAFPTTNSTQNTVYGTLVTITAVSNKISKISTKVTPYALDISTAYLKLGDSLVDHVFGTFKFSFDSVTPALTNASKDYIAINSTGETTARLKWTSKSLGVYDMNMFMPSSSPTDGNGNTGLANATYPYNASQLGYDTYSVATNANVITHKNDYFVTTSGNYSQIWRVNNIDIPNSRITVTDMASGSSSQQITFPSTAIGSNTTITLIDGSSANIELTGNGSDDISRNITIIASTGTVGASSILYTQNGAMINLSGMNAPYSNLSKIVITEETTANNGVFYKNNGATLGSTINETILYNRTGRPGNDIFLNSPVVGDSYSENVSGNYVYYLSKYGTFVNQTGNNNTNDTSIEIYYPGTAAYLGFNVVELIAPSTTIVYPTATTYTDNVSALNYTVSVSSGNLSNCWYSLDSGATNTTVICGTNLTGLTSSEGSNTWMIYTNDSVGNINSSTVTFTKSTPAAQQSSNTGTTGSSGGDLSSLVITDSQISSGYEQIFYIGGVLKFSSAGANHQIILISIRNNEATIQVSSVPQKVTLKAGEEKDFDVNGDSIMDISVYLNSITNNKADITIKKYAAVSQTLQNQSSTSGTQTQAAQSNATAQPLLPPKSAATTKQTSILYNLIIVGGLAAVIILVAIIFFIVLARKKHGAKEAPDEDRNIISQIESLLLKGNELVDSGDMKEADDTYLSIKQLFKSMKNPRDDLKARILEFYNKLK